MLPSPQVLNFAERTLAIVNKFTKINSYVGTSLTVYSRIMDLHAQLSCTSIPLNQCVCMRALKCNKIQKYIAIKLQYINIIKCIFKRFSILIWSKISRYKRQRHVTHIVKCRYNFQVYRARDHARRSNKYARITWSLKMSLTAMHGCSCIGI